MKDDYEKLLKDKRWIIKRGIIKKRDGFKCVKCKSKEKLHVHHLRYYYNTLPWNIKNIHLITVCESCHEEIHKSTKIKWYHREKLVHKITKTKKKQPKIKFKMSAKDKELSDRYSKLRAEGKLR